MSRLFTSSCASALFVLTGCGEPPSHLPATSDRVELTVNPGEFAGPVATPNT
jgi:hypothetical protein